MTAHCAERSESSFNDRHPMRSGCGRHQRRPSDDEYSAALPGDTISRAHSGHRGAEDQATSGILSRNAPLSMPHWTDNRCRSVPRIATCS